MPEIQKLSHRHEAVMNWLLTNPHRGQRECARELGYSESWLSTVINSGMFQLVYRQRAAEMGEVPVHCMQGKMTRVAWLALEKMEERLEREGEREASEKFLIDSSNTVLKSLGYVRSDRLEGEERHLHFHINKDDLARARERAARLVDGEVVGLGEECISG